MKMKKKRQKYPRGWNEEKIRRVLEHYENQTDEEAAAEIRAAAKSRTLMDVPSALVPVVRSLIARHQRGPVKRGNRNAA